jgi:3-deoxy-manno-octulosonate cytidylyltransferase (CMP-KDO synthetase)
MSSPRPARIFGIIPARYGSTRFPGKPLALILDKPMFWHVFQRASQCPELERVVLATDSRRIAAAADDHRVPFVMTRPDHPSGTDRVLEAADNLGLPDNAVVINIQGDEPALHPHMLSELVRPFEDPDVQVATLISAMDPEQRSDHDQVKVVVDHRGDALYFSRAAIPHARDDQAAAYFRHIGLYAFRMAALRRFVALGPGQLERVEKLEQLRLLENGIPIRTVLTRHRSLGVDRPEDIAIVSRWLTQHTEDILP